MLLQDKIAIVTGANRGLGKEIARKLATEGAYVVLIGRKADELAAVKKSINLAGGNASFYVLDLTDDRAIIDTVAQIKEAFGRIDILINNAGISCEQPLMEMPIDTWYKIIDTNLNSAVRLLKSVLPIMAENHSGNIVNIASAAGLRGQPRNSAYSASKAGIIAMTQSLGDELRPLGIRVNVVCPGPIDTEMFKKSANREYLLAAGGDVFQPETIANAVLFFCSDLSKGVSSQSICMRGFNRW